MLKFRLAECPLYATRTKTLQWALREAFDGCIASDPNTPGRSLAINYTVLSKTA